MTNPKNWPNPERTSVRDDWMKPWGYISPFATETLRDRARCDMTITRKQTHNITMPLYTEEQLREAERRAEQRVRAEKERDSERLDWLATQFKTTTVYMSGDALYAPSRLLYGLKGRGLRQAIDAAREVG